MIVVSACSLDGLALCGSSGAHTAHCSPLRSRTRWAHSRASLLSSCRECRSRHAVHSSSTCADTPTGARQDE